MVFHVAELFRYMQKYFALYIIPTVCRLALKVKFFVIVLNSGLTIIISVFLGCRIILLYCYYAANIGRGGLIHGLYVRLFF